MKSSLNNNVRNSSMGAPSSLKTAIKRTNTLTEFRFGSIHALIETEQYGLKK